MTRAGSATAGGSVVGSNGDRIDRWPPRRPPTDTRVTCNRSAVRKRRSRPDSRLKRQALRCVAPRRGKSRHECTSECVASGGAMSTPLKEERDDGRLPDAPPHDGPSKYAPKRPRMPRANPEKEF